MPPNSEIEKLERRWRENPKGTVFAPYAEVLRKNGDHPLAREVLRQGLELHPDHIPGNIVLGRCCLDLGEDGPAEAAFTHVLELDSENVIALKALADITERQGRLLEASRWLGRLVSVDPSNDEARDQLGRVAGAREAAAAVITGQLTAQAGRAAPPDTSVEPAETPAPAAAEPAAATSSAEVASGIIDSAEYRTPVLEAAPPPPPPPAPPAPSVAAQLLGIEDAETVPAIPAYSPPPPPRIHELEPTAFDAEAARDIAGEPPAGIEVDEPFVAPSEAPTAPPMPAVRGIDYTSGSDEATAPPMPAVTGIDYTAADTEATVPPMPAVSGLEFTVRTEESASSIELRPSGASEFQAPDAAADLMDLKPGQSEFQSPDAASELMDLKPGQTEFQSPDAAADLLAGRGGSSEYQTPSGAEELLAIAEQAEARAAEEPKVEGQVLEGPGSWAAMEYPADLALTEAPTAEMTLRSLPPADDTPTDLMELEAPEAEAKVTAVDVEAAAEPAVAAGAPEVVEPVEDQEARTPVEAAATEAESVVAEVTPEPEPAAASADSHASDLPIIYPDAPAAEPPRRRVSQEAMPRPEVPADAEPAEAGAPVLVATETMAELYLKQGHLDDAVQVYRTLLARQPGDARLEARLRQVEAQQQAGRRRLSYLAVETGGESVESFFRAFGSPISAAMRRTSVFASPPSGNSVRASCACVSRCRK